MLGLQISHATDFSLPFTFWIHWEISMEVRHKEKNSSLIIGKAGLENSACFVARIMVPMFSRSQGTFLQGDSIIHTPIPLETRECLHYSTWAPKGRSEPLLPHKSRSRDVCPHFWQFGTTPNKVHTRAPGLWDKWGFGISAADHAGRPAAASRGVREALVGVWSSRRAGW